MARKLDWIYFRKGCNTCKKAQAFLAGLGWELGDHVVDATKERMGELEALALIKKHQRLLSVKGKTLNDIDLKKSGLSDEVLLQLLMGPTGNLRAPTFRHGKTLVVGYDESAYKDVLGV